MKDDEIKKVIDPILQNRLKKFGLSKFDVASDTDFDGGPIIRIRAQYENEAVPTDQLTSSLNEIRSALIKLGEERFVILDSQYAHSDDGDEDME
jgi:hypothetical protein